MSYAYQYVMSFSILSLTMCRRTLAVLCIMNTPQTSKILTRGYDCIKLCVVFKRQIFQRKIRS